MSCDGGFFFVALAGYVLGVTGRLCSVILISFYGRLCSLIVVFFWCHYLAMFCDCGFLFVALVGYVL